MQSVDNEGACVPSRELRRPRRLSTELRRLLAEARERATLAEFAASFGERGFGILLFVLALPNLLPLPPGASGILAIPLALVALQLAAGAQRVRLPGMVGRRVVPVSAMSTALTRLMPWLRRIERLCAPRLAWLSGPTARRFVGGVCVLLALVLLLPVPFGNAAPAAAIVVLALGLLQRDGAAILVGMVIGAASLGIVAAMAGGAVALAGEAVERLPALF